MQMTKEKLKLGYPELVQEIEEVGFKRGKAEAAKESGPSPSEQSEEGEKAKAEIKRLQLASGDPRFLKRFWDEDPEIRAEFRTFDAFKGYYKNRDKTRIIRGRTVKGRDK